MTNMGKDGIIMKKTFVRVFYTVLIFGLVLLSAGFAFSAAAGKTGYINNSDILPKYVDDSKVLLDKNGTPEWINSLIIGEVRTANYGTFDDMIPILDHCAETGINALWLTPINDRGTTGNGYGNLGTNTIDPYLTGILKEGEDWRETDYKEGWKVFKKFVDQAHKRNIRIILDVVSWGTEKSSPLYVNHRDWYTDKSAWGGYEWRWDNGELVEWYISTLVDIAVKTGIDGFRYDLEPNITGYTVDSEVKRRLLESGRKLIYFSEDGNERGAAYDFAELDIKGSKMTVQHPANIYLDQINIVDSIKKGTYLGTEYAQDMGDGGTFQYYSYLLSCHDMYDYGARGNRLAIGYQALFAPFIPIWVLGEEFNNTQDGTNTSILYSTKLKFNELNDPEKRDFFEDVKEMIRIRRTYPEIFEYFADNHRESNICKVIVTGLEEIQSYARYADNKAVIVVPNYNIHDKSGKFKVYIPFSGMKLENYKKYTVTDIKTGKLVVSGTADQVRSFNVQVDHEDANLYLVTASEKKPAVTEKHDQRDTTENSEDTTTDSGGSNTTENNTTVNSGETTSGTSTSESRTTGGTTDDMTDNTEGGGFAPWIIASAVVFIFVLGGGTALTVLLRRKKK